MYCDVGFFFGNGGCILSRFNTPSYHSPLAIDKIASNMDWMIYKLLISSHS